PPRLPEPALLHRTFLTPPVLGIRSPASGLPAIKSTNSSRSASDQTRSAWLTKSGVSATVMSLAGIASNIRQWRLRSSKKDANGAQRRGQQRSPETHRFQAGLSLLQPAYNL